MSNNTLNNVELSSEDIVFFDDCCKKIGSDFSGGYYSQDFTNERNRLINYLFYLSIKDNPEKFKPLFYRQLNRLVTERNLNKYYCDFWTDLLERSDFSRIYEKSEIMNEMRSASPIPGTKVIEESIRGKLFKYLEERFFYKSHQ